jgi:hypothetical protein
VAFFIAKQLLGCCQLYKREVALELIQNTITISVIFSDPLNYFSYLLVENKPSFVVEGEFSILLRIWTWDIHDLRILLDRDCWLD